MAKSVNIDDLIIDTYLDEETGVMVKVYESGAITDSYELRIKEMTKSYISKMEKKWPGRFKYNLTRYAGGQSFVKVTCKRHRIDVYAKASTLVANAEGCPDCSIEEMKPRCLESFLALGDMVHKGKYSYEKVRFNNYSKSVVVMCPTHGGFSVTPEEHINGGKGCPGCK